MKLNNLIFLVSIFFCSCANDMKNESIKNKDIEIIDFVSTYTKDASKLNLSTIASKVDYIPLQTDSSCILGNIDNVKFYNNHILIKDDINNLLLFKTSGEFISKIGGIGRGPGEFVNIGGYKPPMKPYYKDMVRSRTPETYTSMKGFFETKNYMFIEMALGELKKIQFIFRNKYTNTNSKVQYDNPIDVGYCFSFYNDIDGGVPFWPDGIVNENKVFKIVYGKEIQDFLNKTKDVKNNSIIEVILTFFNKNKRVADICVAKHKNTTQCTKY